MGVLAVYDTVGIQNYIFSSNKLAENVGASKLVADIFAETLPSVIAKETKSDIFKWRDHKDAPLTKGFSVEVIYEGGGNAYVAFKDEPTFQQITEKFLVRVSIEAPGLGIAVAAINTDFSNEYKKDFELLNDRLTLVKGGFNIPVFAGNQPITRQSGRIGLPVSSIDKSGEYLNNSQLLKRNRYTGYRLDEEIRHLDFNHLAFDKETDSLIAIIHVDGNNMGKKIKDYMENRDDYTDAVPKIRQLSVKINDCYKNALDDTIEKFETAYQKYVEAEKKKSPSNENKKFPKNPLIKLISDGDDITLVICGRFAIDFAVKLLFKIEETKDDDRPFIETKPTACAGVVIFHSHYPFSDAYKLVEDLCSNAKKPSRDCEGSYIDFHLHQSGRVASLGDLRERLYKVEGKTILRRPWRVSNDENTYPNFKWFHDTIAKCEKEIPHNKLKKIRNAIGVNDDAAALAENELRGRKLPEFSIAPKRDDNGKIIMSDYAAYFDVLEMMDTYVNILSEKGAKDVNQDTTH